MKKESEANALVCKKECKSPNEKKKKKQRDEGKRRVNKKPFRAKGDKMRGASQFFSIAQTRMLNLQKLLFSVQLNFNN